MTTLLRRLDGPDSDKVRALLSEMKKDIAAAELAANLPKDQRGMLEDVEKRNPGASAAIALRDSRSCYPVLESIRRRPSHAADGIFLLLCLMEDNQRLHLAAVRAMNPKVHGFTQLTDRLCSLIIHADRAQRNDLQRDGSDSLVGAAILKLGACPGTQPPSILAALYMSIAQPTFASDSLLADALVLTGDVRVVPHVMPVLSNTRPYFTYGSDATGIKFCRADSALRIVVRLTGQKPEEYGASRRSVAGFADDAFCFDNDQSRQKAIDKLRDWWGRNKTLAPYNAITPLAFPTLDRSEWVHPPFGPFGFP